MLFTLDPLRVYFAFTRGLHSESSINIDMWSRPVFLSNYLTVCNSHPFYIKNTGTQVASAPGVYFSSRSTLRVFSLRIFWVCSSKPRVSPENTPSVLHGFIFCWVRSDRHFTCNSKTEFFYLLAKKNFYLYIAYKSTDNLLEPMGHTLDQCILVFQSSDNYLVCRHKEPVLLVDL